MRIVLFPVHLVVLVLLAAAWVALFASWICCWILQSFHVETSGATGRRPLIPSVSLDLAGRRSPR